MKGTFRRDAELVGGPAALRLQRRTGPRLLSLFLIVAAMVLTVVDARLGRPFVAAVNGVLALGFVLLFARAELDRFSFDGRSAVRRWVTLGGVSEERLSAKLITRVAVQRGGKRARAWLETRSGEQVALVEGDAARVEAMAEKLAQAIRLASSEPGGTLH